ncbi:MAG: hypothetical protein C0393_06725 [Anaerolinea sp.]|nr:hypothetical protein [Anaerolinea sp.]
MEHDDHHDRAGRGVVRVPFGFEILARIGDVGMRCVERIEPRGRKSGGQGRRRARYGRRGYGWLGGWVVEWLGGWVVGWLGSWGVGWLGSWVVGWLGGWGSE